MGTLRVAGLGQADLLTCSHEITPLFGSQSHYLAFRYHFDTPAGGTDIMASDFLLVMLTAFAAGMLMRPQYRRDQPAVTK